MASRSIQVEHIIETYSIDVLSDYLRINYTKEYVMQLAPDLTPHEARRVLLRAGQWYNEDEGINTKVIRNLARGVRSKLL